MTFWSIRTRVLIDISDNHGNTFSTKLDIGIHKDTDIEQDELCFDLNVDSETVLLLANSMEQICIEKLKSLAEGIEKTNLNESTVIDEDNPLPF